MTLRDTTGINEATTRMETGTRREISVLPVPSCQAITGAQYVAASVPSGLPEIVSGGGGYVFRITSGTPLGQVTIMLDTKQLTEQARVKKVNQAIQRARRR